jgi:hypothetical protein
MTRNDLRRKNERLRDQIAQVVEKDPELRDVTEGIALRQDLHVEVGTPFLERTLLASTETRLLRSALTFSDREISQTLSLCGGKRGFWASWNSAPV